MSDDYLFVYGTLRRNAGYPIYEYLRTTAEFVADATLQGRLYLVSTYPGAVTSTDPRDQVIGEIFRLHDSDEVLRHLDQHEGCGPGCAKPAQYVRQLHEVRLVDSGEKRTVWVYFYNLPVEHLRRIASGDFLDTLEES